MEYPSLSVPALGGFDLRFYYTDSSQTYPAKTFPIHLHDLIEIYVLEEGDVSFMVEKHLYRMTAGDVLITKPNEMHNCILNSATRHAHFCFWFRPEGDFLFGDFLKHERGEGNLLTPPEEEKKRILSACRELCATVRSGASEQDGFAAAVHMLSCIRKWIPAESKTAPLPPILQTILHDIDENAAKIHDLSYFCDKYFISGSTLGRLFRQHLGTSPRVYMETKKLSRACVLLRQGKSVTDACLEAGFPDYSNFIRLFRRRFGKTPMQFKRS